MCLFEAGSLQKLSLNSKEDLEQPLGIAGMCHFTQFLGCWGLNLGPLCVRQASPAEPTQFSLLTSV